MIMMRSFKLLMTLTTENDDINNKEIVFSFSIRLSGTWTDCGLFPNNSRASINISHLYFNEILNMKANRHSIPDGLEHAMQHR